MKRFFCHNNVESIEDYASFTYLPDGNLDEILYSNAVTTNFGYDSRGRIQNIHAYTSEDLLDLVYTFDGAGNITGIQNNFRTATEEWVESTESYAYDDLDRLISASNRFGAFTYIYDSKKRLSMTENGQNTSYMYDYDLLLSAGEQTFTYDSNGNTLTKSSEFQWMYHYNNANQLTHVDRDGQTFSHYLYDGDGIFHIKNLPVVVSNHCKDGDTCKHRGVLYEWRLICFMLDQLPSEAL